MELRATPTRACLQAIAGGLAVLAVGGIVAYELVSPASLSGRGRLLTVALLALGVAAADQWPVKLATGRKFSLGGVPAVAALLLMPNALAPAAIAAAR
ncbi:MAG: hypothetical protein M3170_12625, partial [Candidatus Dormibacteraeota bacterium]|nr:hypothetical protein [Candidatus Dormibacteraeota bacterium]